MLVIKLFIGFVNEHFFSFDRGMKFIFFPFAKTLCKPTLFFCVNETTCGQI
eukprot:NODE_1926_length_476_cov_37.156909_g1848_i0.p2 GENE.NODE_1926_length_476_cov_37.156909_g1848_i0~~NODE_1926_length_476_cov_37.156909_g1848_i0.p2  ORF type:complete len:51 (-),score=5.40 NODE_1926_length_476_cov_37.156909_g1848_i0:157-309(-)